MLGNLKLALFLAYKSIIKGSRWTLILVILVMSLSFANLVLTPSIMSGVTTALNQEQINNLFGNIVIDPPAGNYYLENTGQIETRVSSAPGVKAVAPHFNTSAQIEYHWPEENSSQNKGQSGQWKIVGIDPEKEAAVTTVHNSLISGNYLAPGDTNQILLGIEIAGGPQAENQPFLTLGGVLVGDHVRLTFGSGIQQTFTVKGIFKAREGQVNTMAYITRNEMVSALNMAAFGDAASQILVRTQAGIDDSQVIAHLNTLGINGQVRSWKDYGGSADATVSSFSSIASVIGGIGLVVAGVVMFIVIYINVSHRKRQIGILRAIGVNRGAVLLSYLIQSLLYAVVGIIFGGIIIGYVIKPFFDSHPIDLPIGLVSLAIDSVTIRNGIFGLMVAAVLAGIIPVVNITRESIIKAIWGN
jgi:putative ABC transport system permease protein